MRIRLFTTTMFVFLLVQARAEAQFQAPPGVLSGEDYYVELGLMYWKPSPELEIASGGGTRVDFVQDLGVEDKGFAEFRAVLKPGRKHKIRFGYERIKYDEQGKVLQRTILFRGVTYNVNVPVNAELKWDLYRFGYEWDFITMRRGFVGVFADIKYNKVAASLESPLRSEATEANAPVPTIGGIARGYLGDYASITAEFTGLKIDRTKDAPAGSDDRGFRGKFFDFDIYGQVNVNRHLGGQVGYRAVTVDYLVDDDEGEMVLNGAYFGGVVRF